MKETNKPHPWLDGLLLTLNTLCASLLLMIVCGIVLYGLGLLAMWHQQMRSATKFELDLILLGTLILSGLILLALTLLCEKWCQKRHLQTLRDRLSATWSEPD